MKKLILLLFLLVAKSTFSQIFDNDIHSGNCNYPINWGDVSLWNFSDSTIGIWGIDTLTKPVINSPFSGNTAIVTSPNAPYPINDTSYFIIKQQNNGGMGNETFVGHSSEISGFYWSNTDTINDYATIEIKSINHPNEWFDIFSDTNYVGGNPEYTPTLQKHISGNSNGWNFFLVDINQFRTLIQFDFNDTITFRIRFHSDSIADSLDGVAFDHFEFCNYSLGLKEYSIQQIQLFPNPANNSVQLAIPINNSLDYTILDALGNRCLEGRLNSSNEQISIAQLKAGIYQIHLKNLKTQQQYISKIIKL